MRLPKPPPAYSQSVDGQRNLVLERADNLNHKKNRDVEIGDGRLILKSPNGTRYQITVSDAGVVGASTV
jgi:hypothetical protein